MPRPPADVFGDVDPPDTPAGPPAAKPKPKTEEPTPPGPIRLEIRINSKIALTQRVYQYTIDQKPDTLIIQGHLKPPKIAKAPHDEPS